MTARVIDIKAWKAAHPPALLIWQHGLACAVAWQKLWLAMVYGPRR